ncbi:hypothetical protein [Vreelandella olivaria]|uniref:hypothetical protein n=1 Tax=Vreelandella olivaria TaxID=390919 RepID=UPI00201F9159|nr:hypothetical protein [Halomonas olivaria]
MTTFEAYGSRFMKALTAISLATLLIVLSGCSPSSVSSSRTADCRQLAEETGDTLAYGDCIRGTSVNRSGF